MTNEQVFLRINNGDDDEVSLGFRTCLYPVASEATWTRAQVGRCAEDTCAGGPLVNAESCVPHEYLLRRSMRSD